MLEHTSANPFAAAIHTSVLPQARTNLMAGDLVEVSCSSLNGRTWMSTVAPVTRELARGARAELLSDPTLSERSIWVRLRLLDDAPGDCFFVAAQYLDLVEARARVPMTVASPSIDRDVDGVPYRVGDIIRTTVTINLRKNPGKQSHVVATLARDSIGAVLSIVERIGETDWAQIEHGDTQGWLVAKHTRLCAWGERWIEVDLTTQTLTAWNNRGADAVISVSTGKPGFQTPTGTFTISSKIPARRLSATVNGESWDIPGVPWIMVFKDGGFYVHGVYWHDSFGSPQSHGCVTLGIPHADWLYEWTPLGASIWIHK